MSYRASLWILLVACGCDQLFELGARDGGAGGEGSGSGGSEAGTVDAPGSPCTFTTDAFVVPASWWVPSENLLTVVRDGNNGIEYGAVTGKTAVELASTDYVTATIPPQTPYMQHLYPALSADGDRLVVWMKRFDGYDLGIGSRLGMQFSAPQPVSLLAPTGDPIAVTANDHPSAPTRNAQARMLLTSAAKIDELVELTPGGPWERRHQYTPLSLGMASLGTGNLSADGLRMVFEGIKAVGAQSRIFHMKRGDVDAPFTTPVELYNPVLSENPYITNDCTALFFTGGGDARSAR